MFVAFIPAGTLTLAFSAVANAVSLPGGAEVWSVFPEFESFLTQTRQMSPYTWIGLAALALVLLVLTTSITLMLQAASMRGVVAAATTGKASFVESLRLGRAKAVSIIKLSLLFGFITAFISIAPLLLLILIGDQSALGTGLIHLAQTGLSPVTTILNILALLLVMSIALEDVSPRAAFGRVGNVFRKAWWAFLLVFGLSVVSVFVTAVIVTLPFFIVLPVAFINPQAGILLTLVVLCVTILAGLFFFLFTVVFTQTLYALVYREAARFTVAAETSVDASN
jgi:hypothetical protein